MEYNKNIILDELENTLTITIELDRMVLAREKKKILRTNDVIDVLYSLGYNVELTLESATISKIGRAHV